MHKLLLLFSLVSCSHLIETQAEVEVIPVRGESREVKTVQNKIKRDGCIFLNKIKATPVGDKATIDERLSEGLREAARAINAQVVISNLKPRGDQQSTYGLAYKCPTEEEKERAAEEAAGQTED